MPNITPHDLLMDFEGTRQYVTAGEVDPGDQTNDSAFNGEHIKVYSASAHSLTSWPNGDALCRLAIIQGDSSPLDSGPNRFISSVYPVDTSEGGFDSNLAHHYDGQDYYYVTGLMFADHNILSGDDSLGGWDHNDSTPNLQVKCLEITHADTYIDGNVQVTGAHSAEFPGVQALNGHNAIGLQVAFNTPTFQAFDPTQARPSLSGATAHPSDSNPYTQDGFTVSTDDRKPYWTVAFGNGDVTLHDNTGQWALRPVTKNELMWIVFHIKQRDYSGAVGDTDPGAFEVWAITDAEVKANFGSSLTTLLAATPLISYQNVSTNQYGTTSDTSAWDVNNPTSQSPAAFNNPSYMRKRPRYSFVAICYYVGPQTTAPAGLQMHTTGMRRRQMKSDAFKDISGFTSGAATVSGPPTALVATRGNAQATVSFTAPTFNGGATITGYTVTSSPGGFNATGASSPLTVTGLSNGTAYTFTAVATNSVGNSAASAASNSVTPATVPGAPTIGTATAGAGQVSVAFTAPGSNGGSAITSYTATATPGSIVSSSSISPIVVSGLANGTAYTFTVHATNAVGNSVESGNSNSVTPVSGGVTIFGNPLTGASNAQFGDSFMAGNVFQATKSGTVISLAFGFTGPTNSGFVAQAQPFRPIIYNATANGTVDGTWHLLSVGTEIQIQVNAAYAVYTFTGLSGTIVKNNYYLLGVWSGSPTFSGSPHASLLQYDVGSGHTPAGASGPGYYTAMTYNQLTSPTDPFPQITVFGTEDKFYGPLLVSYATPIVGGHPTTLSIGQGLHIAI